MGGYGSFAFGDWWWIFPIVMMIVMMIFCFLMMRGWMMGKHDSKGATGPHESTSSESAREILDKRYALGEISKEEYEEKKRDISN
ncbi:MAG: SHOCT domain-containing protein [Candidatus Thorarchaeota archaeon]|jgi:putative membrane protein